MTEFDENVLSFRRYFINNLDSYHSAYFIKEVAKVLEIKAQETHAPSIHTLGPEDAAEMVPPPPEEPYEIVGTAIDPKIETLDKVTRIIPKNESVLYPQMLACGNIVFDISSDRNELKTAIDYLKLLKDLLSKQEIPTPREDGDVDVPLNRRFIILISTAMTWALTKPLDPSSPDMPFVETDFRKRKPLPSYKMHFDIENAVIEIARKYKSLVGALVVNIGITYGGKEDILYYWFQKAWECEPLLPILGRGFNANPIINVLDLTQIIYNLLLDFPKKLYILAVEQNITKQREIIKPLGQIVGSGMFKCIPPEDAFLIPEIDQRIFDLMTLNLYMEPTYIVESMGLAWTSEATFGENVPALIRQFKKERRLKPFKLVIYGPPIVGKTTLSKQLCENYGLVYVSPDTVVQELINDLASRVHHWEIGETADLGMDLGESDEPVEDDDSNEEETREAAKQTLAMLESGRPLTEDEIIGFMRQRMLSKEAQNKGWVLDGFPMDLGQCVSLFERGDEQNDEVEEEEKEDEQFEEDTNLYDNVLKKLLPDILVSLEATDDFICSKAMRQPEGDPHMDEETVVKRLQEFRLGDTRYVTPLNFFDELDIHPLIVPVDDHMDYDMKRPYADIALRMGGPCRYPKLMALIEAAEKKVKEEHETLRTKEEQVKQELETKMRQEREEKMEYWSELYGLMREEEEAALAAAGEPMRNYLMHHIFPTLTPALLEIAKLRPSDPVDFLAEYLFKLNPTGKMLEPGYNLQAEMLLGKIKVLDNALKELDIKIDPLLPAEAEVSDPKLEKKKNNCPDNSP